uniref:Uncharacterized protein n=1 Tax=Marseillevirus LCMAC201 TaxID=2506605 RepID=A0A481YVJ9_9VIRU|nr:MAG: hypothetical protein LCMAC201_00940 [Marseillevirus LCMAC201]
MIIITVLIFWIIPKCTPKPVESTVLETISEVSVDDGETISEVSVDDGETISEVSVDDGETILDIEEEDEKFGMYSSALSSWLAHHPSGSSVERYTRPSKQQIQSASPVLTDYIPYDEDHRLQNPQFSNHIRTTGNEETTLL